MTSGTPIWASGHLFNGGSAAAKVSCGFGKLTTGALSVFVDFIDSSTTANVSCQAVLTTFDGFLAWQGSTQTFSGTGNGFFNWSIPSAPVGYGEISCTLPVGSGNGIRGINVQ